jgi:hypothetical protein
MIARTPSTFRSLAVTLLAVGILSLALRIVDAGSLSPVAAPAPDSMQSLASISDALVGSTFDSSGIGADANGSAIEIAHCIINRMTGGTCP